MMPNFNVADKNGWIKVSEQKPRTWENVIVACYGSDFVVLEKGETLEQCLERVKSEFVRVTIGYIDNEGFWNGIDGFPLIVTPTYWQPLPEPPKESEEQ